MSRIPEEHVQRARAADCAEIAERLGLRGKGGRYFCPCQPAKDREPDLSTPRGRGFVCHRCKAKGSAIDLVGFVLGYDVGTGAGFAGSVTWIAGDASSPVLPARRGPQLVEHRLPPEGLGDVWGSLQSRVRARAALDDRGIPSRRAESDVADMDAAIARATAWPTNLYTSSSREGPFDELLLRWLPQHLEQHGPAIVAPIRNALTNMVEALHVRPIAGKGNRRTLERTTAPDGTPRGYGWAGACLRASPLLLLEGMADTLAAEALMFDEVPAVAVGAVSARDLPIWATWLAPRLRPGVDVIVVRHLDAPKGNGEGTGQAAARAAVDALVAGGVNARHFEWPAFVRALRAAGLDVVPHLAGGFDLADVLRLARDADVHFDAVSIAFRTALRADAARAPHEAAA